MAIAEGTFTEFSKEFSVTKLQKGIYVVHYVINNQAYKAEKLVIK